MHRLPLSTSRTFHCPRKKTTDTLAVTSADLPCIINTEMSSGMWTYSETHAEKKRRWESDKCVWIRVKNNLNVCIRRTWRTKDIQRHQATGFTYWSSICSWALQGLDLTCLLWYQEVKDYLNGPVPTQMYKTFVAGVDW